RQGFDPSPCGLGVLLRSRAGHADRADELAVRDDRYAALERAGAGQLEEAEVGPTLPDEVLEHLGRSSEGHGRGRLLARDFDAAELGAVHPMSNHQIAA